MSIRLMSQVWDAALPAGEKVLLLCLADWADDDGSGVYGGQLTMARRCSCGERTVRDNLRRLEGRGLLVETSPPGAEHRTRTYRIAVDALAALGVFTAPAEPAGEGVPADPAARQHLPVRPAAAAADSQENLQGSASTTSSSTHRTASVPATAAVEVQGTLEGLAPPPVRRAKPPPDVLWDVLVEAFGVPPHENYRKRRGRALRLIREAMDAEDVPADQRAGMLRDRIQAAHDSWGARGLPVSDIGVANQWQLLGQLMTAASDPNAPVTAEQMFAEAYARGGVTVT